MQGSVRKRGEKWSYYFRVGKVNGKWVKKEKSGFKTKKEAQEALNAALRELNTTGQVMEPKKISVAEYMDYFTINYIEVNMRENSQRARKHIIKNHILPAIGNVFIGNISPAILQNIVSEKAKNYSRNYMNLIYATLNIAFSMAYEWEFIKTNPMLKVKKPKKTVEEEKRIKTLTDEQIQTLLNKTSNSHHYIPTMIALHTGMRAGEIAALQWTDIDLINSTISITKRLDFTATRNRWEFYPPKTKSSVRIIKIGEELMRVLKEQKLKQKENKLKYGEHYTDTDFVSTKENGEPVTTKTISRLSSIAKRAGIEMNFHMLRHTHATLLLQAGVNPKVVQERLGHSNISITMDTYSHVTKEIEEQAVNQFESLLQRKIATTK